MNSRRLHAVFEAYTGGTTSITSAKFLKMMKDATLLDHDFRQSEVDLIFTKNKEKGQRTVAYEGFKKAIEMVAAKKQVSSKDLAEFIILKCGEGPSLTGVTQAKDNRFYDDKNSYTGVHKAGGPTIVDKEKQQLNQLLDRSSADVRGLKKTMKESYHREVPSPHARAPSHSQPHTPGTSKRQANHTPTSTGVGNTRTPPPPPPHTQSHGVQSHVYTQSDEHVFSPPPVPQSHQQQHHHQPGHNPSNEAMLGSLERRLQQTSLGHGSPADRVQGQVQDYQQQQYQQYQQQHYQQPDQHHHQSHQQQHHPQQHHHAQQQHHQPPPPQPQQHHQAPPPQPQQQQSHHQQEPIDSEKQLFIIYKSFCVNHETAQMDSSKFVKLCKDVGFIGPKNHLSTTDADLIFQKTKRSGNYGKRICYEDFRMVAIPEMAKRMQCQPDDVIAHIVLSEGPSLNNVTVTADVRFHDDVRTYTGVKATTGGVNPTYVDPSQTVAIENLLDRSEADNRGVKLTSPGRTQKPKQTSVVMAGEANKKGGIFDRLTNQSSYTGVQKERLNPNSTSGDGHYDISQLVTRR